MKKTLIITVLLSLIAVGPLENAQAAAASATEQHKASLLPGRDRWPTEAWPTAAPEGCDVDTNHLARSLEQLPRVCPDLHSLLMVRHGRLIVERYFGGSHPQDAWNVKSVTKSMLSALVGIALERGYIRSLDQPVLDFFPEYRDEVTDPPKQQITLRHLLTMSAGLEWQENGSIAFRCMSSPDWVRFILKSKLVADPGVKWNYSSAQPHLLSAVLTKASGTNMLAFARHSLFDPIGAVIGQWDQDPKGYYFGGSELCMTPRDMARFGYLYLNNGEWNGKQIVPAGWVRASTQQTNSAHYAFLWWLDTFESHPIYFAQGLGGQHIVVVPDLDAVVVTTSFLPTHISPLTFIKLYVLPCLTSPQQNTASLPSAQQIIERYYQAIGGQEHLARLKSLRITGTRQVPATAEQEPFEMLKGPDGKMISTGNASSIKRVGSNGRIVWSSADGYRILTEQEARYWREEASGWTDLCGSAKERGTVTLENFADRPCYQVQYTAESGETTADFFDAETGFLAGSIRSVMIRPYGLLAETQLFTDYREFGGFQVPTRIVSHVQGPEAVLTRTSVQFNNVNPRAFDLPIPIDAILKGKRESGGKFQFW
jgi:CubicO group peptidase (beta-lactamase class C family)